MSLASSLKGVVGSLSKSFGDDAVLKNASTRVWDSDTGTFISSTQDVSLKIISWEVNQLQTNESVLIGDVFVICTLDETIVPDKNEKIVSGGITYNIEHQSKYVVGGELVGYKLLLRVKNV
jgi:hypothetical protein